jgi:hypothetical protein
MLGRKKPLHLTTDVHNDMDVQFGVYCRTSAFSQHIDVGSEYLQAIRNEGDKSWRIEKVEERRNTKSYAVSFSETLIKAEPFTGKERVTFLEAMNFLSKWEIMHFEFGRAPVDDSCIQKLGYKHFKAFAEREGVIFDDVDGTASLYKGYVPKGIFSKKTLEKAERIANTPVIEASKGWRPGMLSDIFGKISFTGHLDTLLENLGMRGYADEVVKAAEGVKSAIEDLSVFFNTDWKTKNVEAYLSECAHFSDEHKIELQRREIPLEKGDTSIMDIVCEELNKCLGANMVNKYNISTRFYKYVLAHKETKTFDEIIHHAVQEMLYSKHHVYDKYNDGSTDCSLNEDEYNYLEERFKKDFEKKVNLQQVATKALERLKYKRDTSPEYTEKIQKELKEFFVKMSLPLQKRFDDSLSELRLKAEKFPNPADQEILAFSNACEFVFSAFRARAHLDYLRLSQGDISQNILLFRNSYHAAKDAFEKTGATSADVAHFEAAIMGIDKPEVPAFLSHFIAKYENLRHGSTLPTYYNQQPELPLSGGFSGPTRLKMDMSIGPVLQKMFREEKNKTVMHLLRSI